MVVFMWQDLKVVTILFTICPGLVVYNKQKISFLFFKKGEKNSKFSSPCHVHKGEKKFSLGFSQEDFFNLSNKRYFSGSKKTP